MRTSHSIRPAILVAPVYVLVGSIISKCADTPPPEAPPVEAVQRAAPSPSTIAATAAPTASPVAISTETPLPRAPINKVLTLGAGYAGDIEWSADGRQLAVWGGRKVTWYDIQSLDPVEALDVPADISYGRMRFANDDDTLWYVVQDPELPGIALYDVRRAEQATYVTFGGPMGASVLSTDNRLLGIILWEFEIPHRYLRTELWDLGLGERIHAFLDDGSLEEVHFIAISADSRVFAAGSSDGYLRAWDVATGDLIRELQVGLQADRFVGLDARLDPTGSLLAYCDASGKLWFWDIRSNRHSGTQVQGSGSTCEMEFSPDGRHLILGSLMGPLYLLDFSSRLPLEDVTAISRNYSLEAIDVALDGSLFATLDQTGAIDIWETASGDLRSSIPWHSTDLAALAWSPDGSLLAAGSGSDGSPGAVLLWDLGNQSLRWRAGPLGGGLSQLIFSPDSQIIYALPSQGYGTEIRVMHARTGDVILTLELPEGEFTTAALSPDGNKLAVATMSEITLWDSTTWSPAWRSPIAGSALALSFHPDGSVLRGLVEGKEQFQLSLWDPATGEVLREIPLAGYLWDPAFSGTGDQLVVMSGALEYDLASVLDTRTGMERYSIQGYMQYEGFAVGAFTPDGEVLALVDREGIYFYDAYSGRLLASASDWGAIMAFSPDGDRLAVGSYAIDVWDLSLTIDQSLVADQPTITPDASLTQAADTISAFTPTVDLSEYSDRWVIYEDPLLDIRFQYPLIYADSYGGACAPRPAPVGGALQDPHDLRLGDRTWISAVEFSGGLQDYVDQQVEELDDGQVSWVESNQPVQLGKSSALSGYEVQYRFGGLGRLGILYFTEHEGSILVVSFTAGVTCDFREIGLSELDAVRRLLDTLEFTE